MKFIPKRNRILACLARGEVPLGMHVAIPDPSIIEILAYTGFDFHMLCMEHARVGVERMEHCIRAADAAGITTIVRVAENNEALIRQCVEAGAQGIVIPHVKNRKEARKAVEAACYPPEGKMGMCPAIRAAHYSKETWDEYVAHSLKETMVIPLMEGKEGVENAEEILAELRPGVDAVGVGRGDLAQDITKRGERVNLNHPYLAEAQASVMALAQNRGIPFMDMGYNAEGAKRLIAQGVKIMLCHVDQLIFYERCEEIVRQLKNE